MDRFKNIHRMAIDMIVFDIFYFLAGEILILCFLPDKLFYSVGYALGVLFSIFSTIHMNLTLNRMMETGGNAVKISVSGYAKRAGIMVALCMILYYSQAGDIVAALIGMFSLKVSAYLQPFIYRIITKNLGKGR